MPWFYDVSFGNYIVFGCPLFTFVGFNVPLEGGLLLMAMAIDGGALIALHANDSYFWVKTPVNGLSLQDAHRGLTIVTLLQDLIILFSILLICYLFF